MINRMWFQAKETGEFDIGCAQHCGVNHYKMKGILTVLPPRIRDVGGRGVGARRRAATTPKDNEAHWGWEWKARN